MNLQIDLNTPKKHYLKSSYSKNTCQNFPTPQKTKIKHFKKKILWTFLSLEILKYPPESASALVEPGGPWCLTFARQLENLTFFIQITICWPATWILPFQSTGLPLMFLRAQPWLSLSLLLSLLKYYQDKTSMIQKLTLKLYPANTSHNIDAHITLFVLQAVIQNRKMNKKDFHQRLPGQLQGLYTRKDKT